MITQDITFSSEMERVSVNTNFNKPYTTAMFIDNFPHRPPVQRGQLRLLKTLPFSVRWRGFLLTPTSTSRIPEQCLLITSPLVPQSREAGYDYSRHYLFQ